MSPDAAGVRHEVRAAELPVATIVIPMLNEATYIEACLDAFGAQTYPLDKLDVVVVDGGSDDGSRELVQKMALDRPWVRAADNPKRKAAAAFNVGAREAKGDVIFFFSAHGVPDPEFVARSVTVLKETRADGVGGRYLHVGVDPASNAIGLAMVSPFGMASPHRFASERQEVDTISHPAYLRSALDEVGEFNDSLERNSDYELNYRMRAKGMRLVFDPSIVSIYRPRRSLYALGRQFWWYGRWKAHVVDAHPGSVRPRHLVAPAAVAGLGASPILMSSRRGRRIVAVAALGYAMLTAVAVARAKPSQNDASALRLAACFPVMHTTWGAGFLLSFIEDRVRDS